MDDLITLVHSLSPTEKQHFKKRHNPKADFVLLFDYVNKNKSLDKVKVLSYLTKNQKGNKKFTSSYLSVIKTYLKNRILESLRIQFIHKRPNYELLSRSMNTDILLEKGLYNMAKKEIEVLSNKNMESSFPIERLLLLRRKSILDYFENYSNTDLEGIDSLYEERIEMAEQLMLEIKFARILSIMSYQYFNGLNDPDLLATFMDEPYMMDESLSTDFATRYLFHWVNAQFQEFKNNNEKALNHFNQSIKIWLDNPKYVQAHPRMYLGACFTYFKYLIHQKDPFSYILRDINFEVLLSKIETEHLSIEEIQKYSQLFQLFKILSLRQQMAFGQIIKLTEVLTENEKYLIRMPNYEQVIFTYYCALAFFDKSDFAAASDILFDLLNPLNKRLASNPVYTSVYILLHIMVLWEVKNEKHLRHLLPRYKKYLYKENRLTAFEAQFISMASQLISTRYKLSLDTVYGRFHKRLTESLKNDQRGIKIEYEYIVDWVGKKELQSI